MIDDSRDMLAYQLRDVEYKPFVETLGNGSYQADYLTWSVCWDKLKDLYPTATHEWVMYEYDGKPYAGIVQPDGTITVHCKITYDTIDGNTYTHNEYLAVRDFRNKAQQNPDSAQMENTYRRALAKGVSTLTGFGIELWMGEDLREMENYRPQTYQNGKKPEVGNATVDQTVKLDALMRDRNANPEDKERIKKMKEAGWEGVTEEIAAIVIADVKAGIDSNKPITVTTQKKVSKLIQNHPTLSDEAKDKGLKWLETKPSRGTVTEFVNKYKLEGETNAV